MRSPPPSFTAAFVAAVLMLLTASLVILSFRMRATLVDSNSTTDRAVKIGDEISAILPAEVASVVGFQATREARYNDSYQADKTRLINRMRSLEVMVPSLGPTIQAYFTELQSAADDWHEGIDSRQLTTRILPPGEFRQFAFDRFFVMRRAQTTTNRFNEAVLEYQSTQRVRIQQLAYLFMALAVIFGPLAALALLLITQILRRLNATTSSMERRAHEEEMLRQVAHSLTGGLTLTDVLHRITEATALVGQVKDVYIETVDPRLNEVTHVVGYGRGIPATGTKYPYAGSLAQEVLQAGQPRIIQSADIENQPDSIFRNLVRRSDNRSAIVLPLITENHPLGAMCLMRADMKGFTYADVPKVRILADMASMALHRAVTLEKLQSMEDEERFLAGAFGALSSSLDYNRTLKTVANLAVSQLADWCILHMVERERVYHAEIACADPAKRAIAQQLLHRHRARPDLTISIENAIRTRRPLIVPEISDEMLKEYSVDEEHFDLMSRVGVKSAIILPLTVGQKTVGALVLLTSGNRRYNDDDLRRAKKFGGKAALAIHNAQLYAVANDAIQSRDEVLRAVAHDLRNPLSAIQLSAQTLTTSSLPYETHQKMLQSITGASQRMNRLIDDLLAMGLLRAGHRLPLDLHPEDPANIAEQACDMMGPQALKKSIALRWSKPWTPMPSIIVDRSRILQVFTNLLDNALKFTPPGGTIMVSCEEADGGIRFAVKDTGSGIDPTDVDNIFDPFWQSRATAHLGTGLGLAIAKAVVEQHHGRIWVDSKPGAGTTVVFTIPLAGAGEASPSKAAA